MGISFMVAREEVMLIDGVPAIVYAPLYPVGFDRTPVIDLEMPEYGSIPPDNPWSMDLSVANAFMLLRELGLINEADEPEYCGHFVDLPDLIARCEALLGVVNTIPEFDAGVSAVVQGGDGHATMIHCARRPGYMNHRVGRLLELALIAKENDGVISYA